MADGYVVIADYSTGQKRMIKEHRLVMEKRLGRQLFKNENVHHLNGVRDDNRDENLELWVKTQPCGQRVHDLVEFSIGILKIYDPSKLADQS